jgi:hypothetical protein
MEGYLNFRNLGLKNLASMESRQRYTEEINPCAYDADFFERLKDFDKQTVIRIIHVLEDNAKYLPVEEGWIQNMGGVLKGRHPFFFSVRFLHQSGETPLFLEIEETDCDDYLDFVLQDKILIDLN